MYLNSEQVALVSNRLTHQWKVVHGPKELKVRWPLKLESVIGLAGDQPYYTYPNVTLTDGIQVEIQIQVFFAADPHRFKSDKLFKLPGFVRTNWQTPIREYGNYVVRRSLARLSWTELLNAGVQEGLEAAWKHKLDDVLGVLGIRIKEVRLIWVTFPKEVQDMIEKEAKLQIVKGMVDEETYKVIVQQEFSRSVGGFMLPGMGGY